jgi:hypothetical protein
MSRSAPCASALSLSSSASRGSVAISTSVRFPIWPPGIGGGGIPRELESPIPDSANLKLGNQGIPDSPLAGNGNRGLDGGGPPGDSGVCQCHSGPGPRWQPECAAVGARRRPGAGGVQPLPAGPSAGVRVGGRAAARCSVGNPRGAAARAEPAALVPPAAAPLGPWAPGGRHVRALPRAPPWLPRPCSRGSVPVRPRPAGYRPLIRCTG